MTYSQAPLPATQHPRPQPTSFANLSRIELIDSTGRAFVGYYPAGPAEMEVQDTGRTLKIFVGKRSMWPPYSGAEAIVLDDVDRVEIVDGPGPRFVRHYPEVGVDLYLQDDDRTLKMFVRSTDGA